MGLGRLLAGDDERAQSAPVPAVVPIPIPPQSPRPTLRENLDVFLTEIEPPREQGEYVHASSLWELCTKQVVLFRKYAKQFGDETLKVIPPGLRMRFDVGSTVHDLVRQQYLGPMGRLYGQWKCVRCNGLITGKMPTYCACGSRRFDYVEPEYKDEELKLVGHLDGLDKDPLYGLGVLEIKTIDGALFKLLKAPQPEHEFRLHVYMKLAGLSWGRILYVSMALEKKSPFREFMIRFDARVWNRVAAKLKEIQHGGERACASRADPRAISCPAADRCFTR